MKKIVALIACICMVLGLAACGSTASAPAGTGDVTKANDTVYTLKIGTVLNESDPVQKGLEAMKAEVEEKTDGHLVIEIYPSSSLADTEALLEQAVTGANVGCLPDAGRLSNYSPEIGILNGPYLFNNYDECVTIVESDMFKGWCDEIAAKGNIRVLTCNYLQGERNVVSKTLVEKPEDMKGMLIRTIGSDLYLATFSAMGASPQSLPWGEVYNALQTKVIDACEAQYPAIIGANLVEVAPYIAKTEHLYMLTGIAISEEWFKSLPAEYQDILVEAATHGGEVTSQIVIDSKADYEKQLTDAGATITEVDKEAFRALTENAYSAVAGYAELKAQIDEILGH